MIRRSTIALLALSASAAFAADHNFDRTLSTGSAPGIRISTTSGFIHLRPGSDSQIHIAAHLHASGGWIGGGGGDVERRMDEIARNPPINQNGNEIEIGERRGNNDLYRGITIDYEITLPHAAAIHASTGSGDVELNDVGASFKGSSGSGSVRAHNLRGPADLQTGSGDIELQENAAGDVHAQTGSGSIRLRGVNGGLKADTGSGDIEVGGQLTTDWKLETGSGSIRLDLGNTARYTLNASTGSGTIRTAQPIAMQGAINKHHVIGAVNGGGPTLRTNTGSGDIEVR